jgi:predicted dehydrogenase
MSGEPQGQIGVALVGGGRWARVIAGVLLEMPDVAIRIHTASNAHAMREWASARAADRIHISKAWPDATAPRPDAVIIANASHDHVSAAGAALRERLPTLVEKPLALSKAAAAELLALAHRHGALLAVSRVPLFARYFESFAREAAGRPRAQATQIVWEDARSEQRYGEAKHYDPSLPVLTDALPHVLGILRTLCGAGLACLGVTIAQGGMRTSLQLSCGGMPCSVVLARNSDARRRMIELQASGAPLRLDFSQEPGRLTFDGREHDGDPEWNSAPRPLARMLRTFLGCAASGTDDERLDAQSAVEECRIADAALELYRARQLEWLANRLGAPLDQEICYALSEISCGSGRRRAPDERTLSLIWAEIGRVGVEAGAAALRDPATGDEGIRHLLRIG